MSGEREVRIKFTGDSAVLKGSASDVRKIFQNLIADEDDARGAGEKLADAQKQVADNMRKSMAEISAAADVLADSLGPEMVQAIESTGRSVEDEVQRFQKLGLTLDDVKRDSDLLASGMKDLDDAARMGTGSMGDGMRKVASETENSRSVMANFAGNAITELPGVTGAMGPLNMAIGQFAEYATEGNIKLKNMIATGAGIALVAGAMQAVADRTAQVAKIDAFRAENIQGYADALAEAETRVEGIEAHLREIGRVEAVLGDKDGGFWTGGIAQVVDMNELLSSLGLNLEQVSQILAGGRPMIEGWAQAQRDARVESGVVTTAVEALNQQLELLEQGERRSATTKAFLAETTAEVSREVDRGRDSLVGHTSETLRNQLAQEALTRAFERNEAAQRSLTDARMTQFDQEISYRASVDALKVALEAYNNTTADSSTATDEVGMAQDRAAMAARDAAAAYQLQAEQLAASADVPLNAAQSQQKYIESLYLTALSLAPDSPLRAQLVGYITDLQTAPGVVSTKIEVDAEDANTRIGFHRQKNVDAKTAVGELSDALGLLPGAVDIPLSIPGYTTAMSQLLDLKNRLLDVKAAADDADRSVGRVAG